MHLVPICDIRSKDSADGVGFDDFGTSLPGLRQDVRNQQARYSSMLATIPAKLSQPPPVALLNLITSYTHKLDRLVQGGQGHRKMIQKCNDSFRGFRRDIRGTAPTFIPDLRKNANGTAKTVAPSGVVSGTDMFKFGGTAISNPGASSQPQQSPANKPSDHSTFATGPWGPSTMSKSSQSQQPPTNGPNTIYPSAFGGAAFSGFGSFGIPSPATPNGTATAKPAVPKAPTTSAPTPNNIPPLILRPSPSSIAMDIDDSDDSDEEDTQNR